MTTESRRALSTTDGGARFPWPFLFVQYNAHMRSVAYLVGILVIAFSVARAFSHQNAKIRFLEKEIEKFELELSKIKAWKQINDYQFKEKNYEIDRTLSLIKSLVYALRANGVFLDSTESIAEYALKTNVR